MSFLVGFRMVCLVPFPVALGFGYRQRGCQGWDVLVSHCLMGLILRLLVLPDHPLHRRALSVNLQLSHSPISRSPGPEVGQKGGQLWWNQKKVNGRLTLAVDIGMCPETVLHGLELLDAVHPLGLLLAEDEARKGGFELFSTRSLCHTPEALHIGVNAGFLSGRARGLTGQSQSISPVSSLNAPCDESAASAAFAWTD